MKDLTPLNFLGNQNLSLCYYTETEIVDKMDHISSTHTIGSSSMFVSYFALQVVVAPQHLDGCGPNNSVAGMHMHAACIPLSLLKHTCGY